MIIHNIIKLDYSKQGYLPNHPYHLISDKEMIDAFIFNEVNYFADKYPCNFPKYQEEYDKLVSNIKHHLTKFLEDGTGIPNWVYSYMLGTVIGPNSDTRDIHYILVRLNIDNIDDIWTESACQSCYDISKKCLATSKDTNRSPSIFGEHNIIKYLRLLEIGGKLDAISKNK